MRSRARGALVAWVGLAVAIGWGCGSGEDAPRGPSQSAPVSPPKAAAPPPQAAAPQPEAEPAKDAAAEAREIFQTRCAVCHGETGRGDGPASMGLDPKPRDFHNAKWQDSVNDEHIAKVIQLGGVAVGLSPMMAPNPDLVGKPDVVKALVAHIRSLRGD